MVFGVEQMRRIPHFEIYQSEGTWPSSLVLKEGHGVDETHTGRQTLELENLALVSDLTQVKTGSMQRLDDGITVVTLEVMSENGQRLFSTSTPVVQSKKKLLNARVTVPLMQTSSSAR